MGGSGSGRSFTLEELNSLEKNAKEELKSASKDDKSNIFISFNSDDLNDVNLLRGQAKNKDSDLQFKDYSVKEPYDSENAKYIKRKIRERIKQTSITLVYVSSKTSNSKWVNWEINESLRLGKKVIAMHKGDNPPSNLPSSLENNGIVPVKWNHKDILKTINKVKETD